MEMEEKEDVGKELEKLQWFCCGGDEGRVGGD